MKQGQFCFITDEFYTRYDPECKLMRNKETIGNEERNRPCFYAFQDSWQANIFWCVPISSKVKKYTDIYHKKMKRQQEKGIAHPKCSTICFGEVMGAPRVFLIQNMFPVIEKYIASVYIDNNTKMPVTIKPETGRKVVKDAKNILRLVKRGSELLVFSDILKTYSGLCAELDAQNAKPNSALESSPLYR